MTAELKPLYVLDSLILNASRMAVDRLEAAIEMIADDDRDEAARTRAVLVDALEKRRQRGETPT